MNSGMCREGEGERVQAILGFEMADWRWFRQYVRPEDCLMKGRKEGLHDSGPPASSSPDAADDRENDGVFPGAIPVGSSPSLQLVHLTKQTSNPAQMATGRED